MDRRSFLKLLGLGAIVTATPKIIFDMGKNSRIYTQSFSGVIDSKFKVYVDPYLPPDGKKYFIMGYKGKSSQDRSFFYCPYIPPKIISTGYRI